MGAGTPAFLTGGGETGARMRAQDWAATPLGRTEDWPAALKVATALVLNAPESMYLAWGPELILLFNDAYAPLLGPRLDRALGAPWREVWADVWDQVAGDIESVLAGTPRRFEDQFLSMARRGAPERTWWTFSFSPLRDEEGVVRGFLCVTNEQTRRITYEAELRARETELRLVADAMPVLVAFIDRSLTYRFANEAYRAWFDVSSSQEVIGRTVHDFVDAKGYERRKPHFESALSGTETSLELSWPHRDGCERIAEIRYIPRRTDGSVDGFYVFVQDITARHRAEAALVASNLDLSHQVAERTRERDRLWEATNDLMGTAGLDGYLKAVNPAWTPMLGWSEAELLTRPFIEIVDEDDHATTAEVVARLAAGETVTGFIDRVITKDGGSRTLMWNAVPAGAVFYIVGRDVTDQLETEEQLRQAQKMEAVGQLTGGIAHDFNNLLTGIVGSLDLMQTRIAQGRLDTIERYARTAMSSANRAAALTHRLLAFARRQPLESQPVAVNPLITGMEDLLRRTLGERVQLEIVTAGGLWLTLCDPHQLENALLNLAINARDAMADGGRLVIETGNAHLDRTYARTHVNVEEGQYVSLCVTDTGSGMPAEVIARAFDPFFTTKPLGQGTGLGLSMIYGFAKQSGGHVKIYSELGQGTTVKLYLPRYRGAVEAKPPVSALSTDHRAERGETVLVVEDEVSVRELIIEILGDLGYRALHAADGLSGLAILRSDTRVDLVVTDVGLPGMNGRQMVDEAHLARPDLKALFITGYAENATFGNGHLAPGMRMITKPFPVEALATRMREMIEGRG